MLPQGRQHFQESQSNCLVGDVLRVLPQAAWASSAARAQQYPWPGPAWISPCFHSRPHPTYPALLLLLLGISVLPTADAGVAGDAVEAGDAV